MKKIYLKHFIATALLLLTGMNATAQPVINSAYKYARGATMAFVRMTFASNGASVKERGVCCSENPMPTVNDIKANQETQLTKKGPIYWLKELQPGTKYFMRGYVITQDGQTYYGEPMKFYTIPKGQINLTVREGGNQATYNRIKTASETAKYWWDNLTEMKGFSPSVGFVDGTPTADCSYGGWVRVGSNESYQRCGTILHEWLHGVGVIPWANTEWARFNLRSGTSNAAGYPTGSGQWLGDRVTEVLTFLENTETHLNGDYQHMWPYGINGANEDDGSDFLYIGNSLVCQALGEDGLQHTSSCFAQPYYSLNQEDDTKFYIKNESTNRGRYTSFLMPKADGGLRLVEMTTEQALANDSAAWTTTFTPNNQFYQIRNVATGRYITFTSSNFTTVERTKVTANENLQLMKGRVDADGQRGYWLIQPAANWEPKCINAYANGNIAAQTFNIANSAESQRWIIMTEAEAKAFDVQAVKSAKVVFAALSIKANAILNTPHVEVVAGANANLTAAINTTNESIQAAETVTDVFNARDELRNAIMTFLTQVSVSDQSKPFDLTFLMTNPAIDTNTEGWSESATVNYSCAEFYQTTFDFSQTVEDLPIGTYKVLMQGFQRPGSSADSYSDYIAGTNNVNAVLYAGSKEAKIAHIASGAQSSKVGGTEAEVSGKYIPNNMEAASKYFNKKLYDNEVAITTTERGDMKIGLKSESMPSNYWVIFDNFRLHAFGQIATSVEGITINDNKGEQKIFTLDGRRVSTKSSLKPGLYIVNGKKKIVK